MDYPTKKELWEAINVKLSLEEVSKIVDDLEESGKIMIDDDGRIVWTWNPEVIEKIIKSDVKQR